jgi:hypothetical protein
LHDLKPGRYTVRLHFAEIANINPGDRVQTIRLQGRVILNRFDILAEAKHTMTGIVRQIENIMIDGTLTMTLEASVGQSLISGIEVIRVE